MDEIEDLLEDLTPAQTEAVLHVDGPLLILAGPGSGKTRVVTHRIAHLLRRGVPPGSILALTFTNKAAEEMLLRLERLAPGSQVAASTFHRFCARLLRNFASFVGLDANYTIYDTSDSKQALKRAIESLNLDGDHYSPERIGHVISHAKNHLLRPDDFKPRTGDPLDSVAALVYPVYQKQLLTANAVDFDDLLLHVACILRDNPEVRRTLDSKYRYVLVDEYQDTNLAQYAIARALSLDYPNLCATGDPDQSIYGWRGANLNNILEFERDFADVHVVRLEQNYRSTRSILRAAQTLISRNRMRKQKELYTDNEEGVPVRLRALADERKEAEAIAERISRDVRAGNRRPRDFAVFYRTNALSRPLEEAFRKYAVPYQMVRGLEFYQRKEIKDALAYLQLLNNPRDDVAFLRVVNTPPRGISKKTLAALTDGATMLGVPLLEAARRIDLIKGLPKRADLSVTAFVKLMDQMQSHIAEPVEEIMGRVFEDSGYLAYLEGSPREEDADRLENLQELLSAARQYDEEQKSEGSLEEFLEQVCLKGDTDDWEGGDDRATLMTLHASKGLEFPVVTIIAVEENILPHEFSKEPLSKLEEERRLLFVGMTRAQQELTLSYVTHRQFRGRRYMPAPSSFLTELPRDEMDVSAPSWTPIEGDDSAFDFGANAHPQEDWELEAAQRELQEDESGEVSFDVEAFDAEPAADWDSVPPRPAPASSSSPSGARPGSSASPTDIEALRARLTTAAALAGSVKTSEERAKERDAFHQGMAVVHPEYGLGKIIALSGAGVMRRATVAFASGAGEKKFVLSKSPLRPA